MRFTMACNYMQNGYLWLDWYAQQPTNEPQTIWTMTMTERTDERTKNQANESKMKKKIIFSFKHISAKLQHTHSTIGYESRINNNNHNNINVIIDNTTKYVLWLWLWLWLHKPVINNEIYSERLILSFFSSFFFSNKFDKSWSCGFIFVHFFLSKFRWHDFSQTKDLFESAESEWHCESVSEHRQ